MGLLRLALLHDTASIFYSMARVLLFSLLLNTVKFSMCLYGWTGKSAPDSDWILKQDAPVKAQEALLVKEGDIKHSCTSTATNCPSG